MPGSVPGSEQGRHGGCPQGVHSWVSRKVGGGEADGNQMLSRRKVGCLESLLLGP